MVQVKGTVVGDAIKTIKTKYGEGAYNTILGLLKPETRAVFDKKSVMPMDWYLLDDFIEFLSTDLKVTANGNEQELVKRSEELIGNQLTGIYKIFVKLGKPSFVLNRIAIVNKTYFQGVDVQIGFPNPGMAIVKLTGLEKQHRLIGLSLIGFYRKALDVSGAKNIKATFLTPIEEGKGYCQLELKWDDN